MRILLLAMTNGKLYSKCLPMKTSRLFFCLQKSRGISVKVRQYKYRVYLPCVCQRLPDKHSRPTIHILPLVKIYLYLKNPIVIFPFMENLNIYISFISILIYNYTVKNVKITKLLFLNGKRF